MQETRRTVLESIDGDPVSGPDLADELGVSRAAVWKHVEALREAGFGIENDDGYVLRSVHEYGATAVEFGLNAPYDVEFHETIPSTNTRARELAVAGESNVVVLADAQTGGRGRLDRGWISPSGGVWMSVVCRPDLPPAHAPLYTLAVAVATTRSVRAEGVDAGIKWPNDVLVRGGGNRERKLAGILTEMQGEAKRIAWIVVGIGLNANVDPAALPPGATSLREQVGDVDRRALVQRLLREFDGLRNDAEIILPAWREHALTLGRRVRVNTPRKAIVGRAVDVTFPGSLVVETEDGRVEVTVGDCEHLWPA